MRLAYMGLSAVISGVGVTAVTFVVGLAVAPAYSCPLCDSSGLCPLMACRSDVMSHIAVAALFGLVAAVITFLALRRWARSRT